MATIQEAIEQSPDSMAMEADGTLYKREQDGNVYGFYVSKNKGFLKTFRPLPGSLISEKISCTPIIQAAYATKKMELLRIHEEQTRPRPKRKNWHDVLHGEQTTHCVHLGDKYGTRVWVYSGSGSMTRYGLYMEHPHENQGHENYGLTKDQVDREFAAFGIAPVNYWYAD